MPPGGSKPAALFLRSLAPMDMHELGLTALRASAIYVFLLVVLRVLGKRTVGHATAFDFMIALILGEVVDEPRDALADGEPAARALARNALGAAEPLRERLAALQLLELGIPGHASSSRCRTGGA